MAKQLNVNLAFTADTSQAKKNIDDLASSIKQISSMPPSLFDDDDLKDAVKAAQQLETHLSKAYNTNTGNLDLSKFSKSLSKSGQDLNYFQKNLSKLGVDGERAFLNLAKSIATAEAPTIRINNQLAGMLDNLKKTAGWQLSSSIIHGFMGAVQGAYGYAQDLNESLTNIRIVTGQNTEQMAEFAEKANRAAKALSTTTTEYTNAALIYYQQGLNDEEVQARTDITIKMANAAGSSAEKVSDQMTAVWNNFYDGSKSLEYYADVLTALGAATSSSTDEIVEGVQKFAAVADTVGLSYEYAASALATVTATTRESADVVGTAFKTLFARIQGLQLGETLDDGTTLNKYSKALESVGISIFETNGEIKAMDNILDELGDKWETLAQDQKTALAQTVAGVRQYTQLIALMDNWDFFQENLTMSYGAEGSLNEQAEIYAESWEASADRVRAAAEGIYDNLIDEDFFISLNDNLAIILEGVEGLVSGLGGMEGIISTVGGLFFTYFAKEAPNAISKLTDNFKVFTGKAQKEMTKMQQDTIDMFSKMPNSNSLEMKAEKETLITITKMKNDLAQNSGKLSEAEKEEYRNRIQTISSIGEKVVALSRQADAAKKASDAAKEEFDKNSSNYVLQLIQDSQQATTRVIELDHQLKELRNSNNADQTQIDALNEDLRIAREEASYFGRALKDIKISSNLTKELNVLKDFDFSKPMSQQNAIVRKAFKDVQQVIQNTSKGYQDYIKKFSKTSKIIEQDLENEKNIWEDNTRSIEESKKAIEEYLKKIRTLANQNDPDIDINIDSTAINNLQELENNLDSLPIEQAKEKFKTLLDYIIKTNNSNLNKIYGKIESLEKALQLLRGATNGGTVDFEEFQKAVQFAGQIVAEAEDNMESFGVELDTDIKHTVTFSETITSFAGNLMELNGVLNSVRSISDIFSDEEASAIEKTTAVVGGLVEGLFAAVSVYQTLDKVNQLYIASKKAENAINATTIIGIDNNTKAVNTNKIALMSHPLMLGLTLAITAITAAIGIWTAHVEENTKRLKENAEEASKIANENKEIIDSNNNLIRSYKEILELYKETGEGKEELDDIAKQLAETYGVEGAAIAKLTGDYTKYLTLLEKVEEARRLELIKQQSYEENAAKAAGEIALESQPNWGGIVAPKKAFNLTFNSSTQKGLYNEIKEILDLYNIEYLDIKGKYNQIDIQRVDTVKELKSLYDALKQVLEILPEGLQRNITLEFLNKIDTEQLENYVYHLEQAESLMLLLDETTKTNGIDTYNDFDSWIKKVTSTLQNNGKSVQEINSIIQELINTSSNIKLDEFYEIYQVMDQVTSEIENPAIKNVVEGYFDSISKGKGTFDLLTLATINWSQVTTTNFTDVIRKAQNYQNLLKEIQEVEKLKIGSESALSALGNDGVTEKNREELLNAIDWGNESKGLINFSDFELKSVEEQVNYLENLFKSSSQAYMVYTKQQIESLKQQANEQNIIAESYNEDVLNNAEKTVNTVRTVRGLWEQAKNDLNNASTEEEKTDIINNYNEAIKAQGEAIGALGEEYKNIVSDGENFLYTSEYGYEKTEKLAEGYSNATQVLNDFSTAQNTATQATKEWQELEKKLELEIQLHPEFYLDDLQIEVKKLEKEISDIKFDNIDDLDDFEEKINKLVEREKLIEIGIKINNEKEIEKLEQKIDNLSKAAAKITDDYEVQVSDLEELMKVFPATAEAAGKSYTSILQNSQIVSGETIRLNKEVAEAFIEAAKIESDTAYQAKIDKTQIDIDYYKSKIIAEEKMLEAVQGMLLAESNSTKSTTEYMADLQEGYGLLCQAIDSRIEKSNDDQTSSTLKNIVDIDTDSQIAYENMLTAGEHSYKELAAASKASMDAQIYNYGQLTRAFLASSQGKLGEVLGLRNSTILSNYTTQVKPDFNPLTSNVEREKTTEDPNKDEGPKIEDYISGNTVPPDEILKKFEEQLQKQIESSKESLSLKENEKLLYETQKDAAKLYYNNIKAGLGPDGKKNTSGGDKEDKYTPPEAEESQDDVDVYRTINEEIDNRNDLLEDQQQITEHIKEEEDPEGKKESLQKEIELIESVNDSYKQKQVIAESEFSKARKNLETLNLDFQFGENGLVTNAVEIMQKLEDDVNNAKEKLKTVKTQEEEDMVREQIADAERIYNEAEKWLKKYYDTRDILKEIKNLIESNDWEVQDILAEMISIDEDQEDRRKKEEEERLKEEEKRLKEEEERLKEEERKRKEQQEENYRVLNQNLEFSLNINDKDLRKIDYYLDKVSDDLYSMAEAMQLVQSKIPHLESNLSSYESFFNELSAAAQAGNITQEDYLEGLNKAYDGIFDQIEALQELDEEMQDYYGETLSLAQEEMDSYTSRLEHLTGVLEHYKNIVELVNGEYDFDRIGTILDGQIQTVKNEMDAANAWYQSVLAEQQAIEAQLAATSDPEQRAWLEKAYKDIYKTVDQAHENLLNKTEEFAQAARAKLENEMSEAAHNMEMIMTDGIGFDLLNESMNRVNSYQDVYLTKTNQIYETQKLMRTAQQAADKTDNAAAKARIKNFIDETGKLQNKNKLSKLELEIQQAQYDLLLAQIALEDAQNAKSTVRLQRDSTGNFGYVYTADQEQIANAEQNVLDAEQNIYNISLEAANEYGQKRIELQQQLAQDLMDLEELHMAGFFETEEAYYEARDQLISEYEQLFIAYEDQYNLALETDQELRAQIVDRGNKWRLNSEEKMTIEVLKNTDLQKDAWIRNYDAILNKTKVWRVGTDQELDLAERDADNWKNAVTRYTDQCEKAYIQFQETVSSQSSIINKVLNDTATATNEVTGESDALAKQIITQVVPAMQSELLNVRNLTTAYSMQRAGLQTLIQKYMELASAIRQAILAAQQLNTKSVTPVDPPSGSIVQIGGESEPYDPPSGSIVQIGGESEPVIPPTTPTINSNAAKEAAARQLVTEAQEIISKVHHGQIPLTNGGWRPSARAQGYSEAAINLALRALSDSDSNPGYNYLYDKALSLVPSYDTGGYTGAWGSSGRLALLHQKELVLNDSDTSNFLAATGILRDISKLIDLESIANRLTGVSNIWAGSLGGANTLEQMVQIEAHFPNATDRNEIEEAFSNLLNTASQYANRK